MPRNTPTLASLIAGALDTRLAGVRVAMPGQIVKFDRATGKAQIQPLIDDVVPDGQIEDNERTVEALPIINDVPVLYFGAAVGGHRIKFALAPGDIVLLIWCSSSLDKWLSRGGRVDPLDDRHHDLSDAVAIPGLLPFSDPDSGGVHESALTIDSDGDILVGGSKRLATLDELNELRAFVEAHGHIVATTGSSSAQSGTAAPPTGTPGAFSGTSKLKGG